MQLPHDSFVLVADGRKMLFLRNEGDSEYPRLEVESQERTPDLADRDQKSDGPGRAFSSAGAGRSAYEEADFHRIEEERFAAAAAAMLKRRALDGEFESLIVVAPPQTLGALRKHYHKEVERRLAGEVAKDLTGHPIAEIEKILLAQE